jgi:hypothetical protein
VSFETHLVKNCFVNFPFSEKRLESETLFPNEFEKDTIYDCKE